MPEQTWSARGPAGSTPLDPDDALGLIPSWVATRDDLNQVEQANILTGLALARWRRPTTEALLDDLAVRRLHRDLFGDVWEWAGSYRTRELSIGVDPRHISTRVRDLMEDAKAWATGDRPMPTDELAYRFHHRLVQIHPFANGNGRHARVMTNLLLSSLGAAPFSWGRADLESASAIRSAYVAALRAADEGAFLPLAAFVRS